MLRAAVVSDLDPIAAVIAGYETAWFGRPEQDRAEVAEMLGRVDDWAADVRLAEVDGESVAVAWRYRTEFDLLADPDHPAAGAATGELARWLAAGPPGELQVLDRDGRTRDVVTAAGWRHTRSAFQLQRDVDPDWVLPTASLPDGVELRVYEAGQAAAVHHLVYVDASWAHIAGHNERGLAEWHALFLAEDTAPEPPVVAWRADRPVGAALSRIFSDGTGWVSQLAVARTERGRGLGRTLLLETLARLRDAGATRLALGVQAVNRGALGLYLDAGLRIDREFHYYAPPGTNSGG